MVAWDLLRGRARDTVMLPTVLCPRIKAKGALGDVLLWYQDLDSQRQLNACVLYVLERSNLELLL